MVTKRAEPMALIRQIYRDMRCPIFKLLNGKKERFTCPVCHYHGPFIDIIMQTTGLRRHARCPKCASLERNRIQYLVLQDLSKTFDFSNMIMIHFAPEPLFRKQLKRMFKVYITADLFMENVDVKADLRYLPFGDSTHDFVFASHVLEHIKDDYEAIAEVRRILRPAGVAVLPVPIIATKTVEYNKPRPSEAMHVRAPGPDYYERYHQFFSRVTLYYSGSFPSNYQTYLYADRTKWQDTVPERAMEGYKHSDIVPVCFV